MGTTEVTQRQWNTIMDSNPSRFQGDLLPVDSVSLNNATQFCKTLTRQEGVTYRLLTEVQW